jgi:hypothetical protein
MMMLAIFIAGCGHLSPVRINFVVAIGSSSCGLSVNDGGDQVQKLGHPSLGRRCQPVGKIGRGLDLECTNRHLLRSGKAQGLRQVQNPVKAQLVGRDSLTTGGVELGQAHAAHLSGGAAGTLERIHHHQSNHPVKVVEQVHQGSFHLEERHLRPELAGVTQGTNGQHAHAIVAAQSVAESNH